MCFSSVQRFILNSRLFSKNENENTNILQILIISYLIKSKGKEEDLSNTNWWEKPAAKKFLSFKPPHAYSNIKIGTIKWNFILYKWTNNITRPVFSQNWLEES